MMKFQLGELMYRLASEANKEHLTAIGIQIKVDLPNIDGVLCNKGG
jgi:hypothetical protein